ncbi:hypothetical protein YC2023_007980 [Brassica napus]
MISKETPPKSEKIRVFCIIDGNIQEGSTIVQPTLQTNDDTADQALDIWVFLRIEFFGLKKLVSFGYYKNNHVQVGSSQIRVGSNFIRNNQTIRFNSGNRGFPATVVNRLFLRGPRHSMYFWDLTLTRMASRTRTAGTVLRIFSSSTTSARLLVTFLFQLQRAFGQKHREQEADQQKTKLNTPKFIGERHYKPISRPEVLTRIALTACRKETCGRLPKHPHTRADNTGRDQTHPLRPNRAIIRKERPPRLATHHRPTPRN